MNANEHGFSTEPSEARPSLGHSPSFHVSWRLPRAPRIVLRSEPHALGDSRMIVQPEFDERARVWIVERHFAQNLEGVGRFFRRIWDNAVDYFESIDIGVVFEYTAERTRQGLSQKSEDGQRQQQHGQRGPVRHALNFPAC